MNENLTYDVVFHSHASSLTGFGHASRCVKIARHLNAIDKNLKLGFTGSYSSNALILMEKIFPINLVDTARARVSFYDRMDDPERPQIYDKKLLDKVVANSKKIIFQANGLYPPDLPDNVICVGYKPNDLTSQKKNVLWGLKYAPTDIRQASRNLPKRDQNRVLVALGGDRNSENLEKVVEALHNISKIKNIEIILSPVIECAPNLERFNKHKKITCYRNLDSVDFLLGGVDLVITSYGHFSYEAIAAGTAVCVFGQKHFQMIYAKHLAENKLCVAGGLLPEADVNTIAQVIEQTLSQSIQLRKAAKITIDGGGILRLAKLIMSELCSTKSKVL